MLFLKLQASAWEDYQLLDSGDQRKLERFGDYLFIRPEPQAAWQPRLSPAEWAVAHGRFENEAWIFSRPVPDRWQMRYRELSFWVKPAPFRHMGVFPEQAPHWEWLAEKIGAANRPLHLLNLFGYTGISTLFAARSGAKVTHVDASHPAIVWARDNQVLANLEDRPVRWIVEDAVRYTEREIRRGTRYDGFIFDPPPFGRGPKGEVWKFKEGLPDLLNKCRQLWSEQPLLVILTAYTTQNTLPELRAEVARLTQGYSGSLSAGTVGLLEKSGGRVIEPATFVRWHADVPPRT